MSVPNYILCLGLIVIGAYFIGSIPTGYWLAKYVKGIDIRQMGSGSTGATNVYRTVGKAAGVSVFVIDFLKGYLPVIYATAIFQYFLHANYVDYYTSFDDQVRHCLPVITAAATLIGHSRSIFLNFKGGKSAATGLGTLFALSWKVGLSTFATWMVILYLGKMVSLASILATASCIPYMIFFGGPPSYIIYCILGFLYVAYRHKDNIKRIMSGTEPKIGKIKQ